MQPRPPDERGNPAARQHILGTDDVPCVPSGLARRREPDSDGVSIRCSAAKPLVPGAPPLRATRGFAAIRFACLITCSMRNKASSLAIASRASCV